MRDFFLVSNLEGSERQIRLVHYLVTIENKNLAELE